MEKESKSCANCEEVGTKGSQGYDGMKEKKLLTRHQAALLLGVTDQSISNYVSSGLVVGYKGSGRTVYVVKESVERLLVDHRPAGEIRHRILTYKSKAEKELRESRSLFASTRQGCSVLRLLSDVDGRDLLQTIVQSMGLRHLSETQERVIVSFLENWDAARVMGEYGVTLMGFRFRVKHAIKALSSLPSYSALEDKIDELQKWVSALSKRNDDLEAEVKGLRAKLGIKERLNQSGTDYNANDVAVWELLQTPTESLKLGMRERTRLLGAGAHKLVDIVGFNETDLLKIRGFGINSLRRVRYCLEGMGLHFGMDVSRYVAAYAKLASSASERWEG